MPGYLGTFMTSSMGSGDDKGVDASGFQACLIAVEKMLGSLVRRVSPGLQRSARSARPVADTHHQCCPLTRHRRTPARLCRVSSPKRPLGNGLPRPPMAGSAQNARI